MGEFARLLHAHSSALPSQRRCTLLARKEGPSQSHGWSFLLARAAKRKRQLGRCCRASSGPSFQSFPVEYSCALFHDHEEIFVLLSTFPYINIFMQMSKKKLKLRSIVEYACGLWGGDQPFLKGQRAYPPSYRRPCTLVSKNFCWIVGGRQELKQAKIRS